MTAHVTLTNYRAATDRHIHGAVALGRRGRGGARSVRPMTGGDEREINEQFHAAAKAHAEAVALVKSFGADYAMPYNDPGHPRRRSSEKRTALDAALDQERKATVAFAKAIERLGEGDGGGAE